MRDERLEGARQGDRRCPRAGERHGGVASPSSSRPSVRPPPRPRAPGGTEAAEALLAAVPGVSTVSARELLARFGSVAGVVAASLEELLAVPGIGPERARALDEAFRAGPDRVIRSRPREDRIAGAPVPTTSEPPA